MPTLILTKIRANSAFLAHLTEKATENILKNNCEICIEVAMQIFARLHLHCDVLQFLKIGSRQGWHMLNPDLGKK